MLQLKNYDYTVIYGHLKLSDVMVKVGDTVTSGTKLANLGNEYSPQTGGERKHLHFGIYKGKDLYFKGYEPTKTALENRWIDPIAFLNQHISPQSPTSAIRPVITMVPEYKTSPPLFTQLLTHFKNFFFGLFQKS